MIFFYSTQKFYKLKLSLSENIIFYNSLVDLGKNKFLKNRKENSYNENEILQNFYENSTFMG